MNATISLAIIVKNAEATFDRCLSTFSQVADEIVIVDTGSTDKTLEIAKKFTDKIFHREWIDDFSDARNYCFEQCTKDFILWVDSDDYILPEDIAKIKNFDFTGRGIIICNYVYAHDEFGGSICNVPRERIVKRSLGLKWMDPIHEYLPIAGHQVYVSDISTHHNKQHGTSERNLELLERVVQKKDSSRSIYYLGKEYMDFSRIDEAIYYLNMFVQRSDGFWEDVYTAHYRLAKCYLSKGDEQQFLHHIWESIKMEDRRAEPFYELANYWLGKENYDKAIQWYEMCLSVRRPKDLLATYQPEYQTWLPCLQLCVCYNHIGDIKKAYEYNKRVLEYRPHDSRALNNDRILSESLKKPVVAPSKALQDGKGKKLNLGCGGKKMPGYVNCDLFKGPTVDEVFDLDSIPYKDGTISAISSEHSLEHVPFDRAEKAIREWNRVLAPGGELMLYMPDFDLCCRSYINAPIEHSTFFKTRCWFKNTVYGIQKGQAGEPDDAQIHKCGFSKEEMKIVLERNNFIVDYIGNYPSDDFLLPKDMREKPNYYTPSFVVRAVKPVSNMKIGWVSPENWDAAQTRIRVLNVHRKLRAMGYRSALVNYPEIINQNFDVAIVGKGFDEHHFTNIKWLKRAGKTVYADCCESLFEFPWFKEILGICDKVICCSPELERLVKEVNPNTIVIEDALEN
jgi:glycosyltransferase involved in cell wall biosynthesis